MYLETRGRELPGNYNHSLLQELFHAQSSMWGEISRSHIDSIVALVTRYLNSVFQSILKDATVRGNLWKNVKMAFDMNVENAHEEIAKLLQDEQGHLITYSHYYTENIQKARHENAKKLLESSVTNVVRPNTYGIPSLSASDITGLVDSLQTGIKVNMLDRACSEALTDLNAYYKVSYPDFET
jgi:hypothetical protein